MFIRTYLAFNWKLRPTAIYFSKVVCYNPLCAHTTPPHTQTQYTHMYTSPPPPHTHTHTASAGASEFEKRRRAFEREPTNIQLLTSPGMTFGMSSSSQRVPGQEQPRRSQRVEEVSWGPGGAKETHLLYLNCFFGCRIYVILAIIIVVV